MLGAIFVFGGIGFLIGGPIGALIGLGIAIYGLLNAKKNDREENLKPNGSNIFKQEKIETVAAVNNLSIEDKIIKFNRQHRIFLDKQEDRCEIERLVKIYHFLNEHNIKCLYHFTDMRNIQSIKQTGGLYSWKESQERGIKIKRSGGNDFSKQLDTRYGLERYVRLSFCKDHPMMYVAERQRRIEFAVILQINPLVACLKSTQFSNMNATKRGHSLGDTCEFLSSIPFEVFSEDYRALSEESKNYYQAEILVNGSVPIEDILNINTVASSHEDVYKESLNGLSKIFLKGTAEFVQESANFLSKSDVWLKEFNKQLQLSKEEQERKDDELKREYLPKVQYIKKRLENFYNDIPHEYTLYIDRSEFFTDDKKFISYFDNLEQKRGSELKILYDASFKTVNSEQKLLKIFRSEVENLYTEKSKKRLEWSPFIDDILYLMSIVPETNKPRILKQIDESLKFNLSTPEEIESKNILENKKISFKYHPASKEELKKLVEDESIYLGDINTSFITDMSRLFENSKRTDFSGIEKWKISKVEDMSYMFKGALQFNSDISGWDVSNVKNMRYMFCGTKEFNSDLSKWNVSNVTDMQGMFSTSSGLVRSSHLYKSFLIYNLDEKSRRSSKFNSDLSRWDVSNVTDMSYMFCGASQFNSDISQWDVSNVTNMGYMFSGATEFNSDISGWNVSNVKNMKFMFEDISKFNSDLSCWDVSNVTDMGYMFYGASQFNSDLSHWNVSNVKDMSCMFEDASEFISDLSRWDVSNVTNMCGIFKNASQFNSDLSQWNVSNVMNMSDMFYGASQFNSDLSRWDVSNVTDMSYMFSGASYFNSDLSHWNVSNVKNMCGIFKNASQFNSDLSQWNVSNVMNMSGMFYGASQFNSDISRWNVANVENMSYMFYGASQFNSDLCKWDVSNVKNMCGMFYESSNFNSDLSQWNVSNVTKMWGMFYKASNFTSDLSNWDVSNVVEIYGMFKCASKFNSDLSKWDVSNVTHMGGMFREALEFNSDLSKWNVSKVTNMNGMFRGAVQFNSDLNKWDVSNVHEMDNMFDDATLMQSHLPVWYRH